MNEQNAAEYAWVRYVPPDAEGEWRVKVAGTTIFAKSLDRARQMARGESLSGDPQFVAEDGMTLSMMSIEASQIDSYGASE